MPSTVTLAQGWTKDIISGKRQTHGVNFTSAPVFSGSVDEAAGNLVSIHTSSNGDDLKPLLSGPWKYYFEFTDGPAEGHRFDLSDAGIALGVSGLKLDLASPNNTRSTLPSGVAASHFVIRKHRTLGEIFPNSEWSSSVSAGTSDQILIYTGNGYHTYWNFSIAGYWTETGSDQGGTILAPGHGVFIVKSDPDAPRAVLQIGEVRYNDFIRPLRATGSGLELATPGYPFGAAPAALGMSTAKGFIGSASPGSSTQVQQWQGDSVINANGYDVGFLHASDIWLGSGTSGTPAVINQSELFRAGRGTFVKVVVPKIDWTHPMPWVPAPWSQP
jgi:hypothetical protein